MTLKGHTLCFKIRASFGAHHENLNEYRLHNEWRRCSPMTLDSDNIRFMRIFAGVPHNGSYGTNLKLPKIYQSVGYIFVADSYSIIGLSSCIFSWWASKDARILTHSAYWPFRVIQGEFPTGHKTFIKRFINGLCPVGLAPISHQW